MKSKKAWYWLGLFSLFILPFISSASHAQNYEVSGAGSASVNGTYTYDRDLNGKPHYTKAGSPTFYMYYSSDMMWMISEMDDGMFWDAYYYNNSSDNTPPADNWERMGMGDPPAPTVSIAGPKLTYSGSVFTESVSNNGSIVNSSPIIITHNNHGGGTFTGTNGDNFVPGKLTVTNLPAGLTAVATRTSSTSISVTITGNAASHAHANDISNLTFAFQNSAFSTNDAASVTSSTKSNLSINFIDQLNVGAGQTYGTIADAITNSHDGDIINITAGTYTESGLSFSNKSLHFVGASPSTTIIQAAASYNTATTRVITGTFDAYSVLNQISFTNLTLRYGKTVKVLGEGRPGRGGAFYTNYGNVTITNCEIVSNVHDDGADSWWGGGGGGICVFQGNLTVSGSTFTGNSVFMRTANPGEVDNAGGGAILFVSNGVSGLSLNITNCTFASNTCNVSGGAIMGLLGNSGAVSIINSTFYGNSGRYGGAFCSNSDAGQSLAFKNCIFNSNTASAGGTDMYSGLSQTAAISTCLLQSTSAGNISGFDAFTSSNTSSNPLLSALADNGGPTRTMAVSAGSPAINAGTASGAPSTDQRGWNRDGSADIGAYEYEATALPVELAGISASLIDGAVELHWKTATEVNNYGFEVERRSADGKWEKIGFVPGHGNSYSVIEYSFKDEHPAAGKSLYRLKQLDNDGKYKYYEAVSVTVDAPVNFKLMQNSPNPFNPSTAIKFLLPVNSFVSVRVYDFIGREVATLVCEEKAAGSHIVYWNGKDSNGSLVSSGVYLYRITAGKYSETRKMNLLK